MVSIVKDRLIPALEAQFPGQDLCFKGETGLIATFATQHQEVGDVSLFDDGQAVMISIGSITHGHFSVYSHPQCTDLRPAEVAQEVVESVIEFLEDLFADRVMLWRAKDGRSGGWSILEAPLSGTCLSGTPISEVSVPKDASKHYWVWSGPLR